LRPREIIRLTMDNINLREKYLQVETKTKRKATKKLVGPIVDFLRAIDIDNLPGDAHLFTKNGVVEVWTAKEKTKVDYFGNRFEKVKNHFKFSKDYGIYSFRHTAAIDLFYSFMKQGLTEHESILKLMPITGHATETALRNYLRDVGGMLPKDYGADYTLEF
jgi:integrase